MTRKTYVPNPDSFKSYYIKQAQHGGGTLPAFRGARVQRGYGIGSFLGNLFRTAVPFLKEGAKAVGRSALNTGLNIANDVIEGKQLKSSARTRAIEAKNSLTNKALNTARNMLGQTGKGIKRRASPNQSIQPPNKTRKASIPAAKRRKSKPKQKQTRVAFNDIFA